MLSPAPHNLLRAPGGRAATGQPCFRRLYEMPQVSAVHPRCSTQVGPPGAMTTNWPQNQLNTQRRQQPQLVTAKRTTAFCTYNARSLRDMTSVCEVASDLAHAGIQVCGIQEARQRGSGMHVLSSPGAEGWVWLHSGHPSESQWGVGALISPAAARAMRGPHTPISHRLMTLCLNGPIVTTVVVAYAPTNVPAHKEECCEFFQQLGECLAAVPQHHMVVVLGDLNARIGTDWEELRHVRGPHGAPKTRRPHWLGVPERLPQRVAANHNGQLCLAMCAAHGLMVANSRFQHRDDHTASFVNRGGRYWATPDLVLVSSRFASSVRDCRVMPRVIKHNSDHRPVVCTMQLRLRSVHKPRLPHPPRFDISKLSDPATLIKYQAALATELEQQPAVPPTSPSQQHAQLLHAIHVAAGQHPGHANRTTARMS